MQVQMYLVNGFVIFSSFLRYTNFYFLSPLIPNSDETFDYINRYDGTPTDKLYEMYMKKDPLSMFWVYSLNKLLKCIAAVKLFYLARYFF